jgi:GTPase
VVVGHTADVLVRRRAGEGVCAMEVRVAIIGNVDSGKSTLVGVLTRSMLDDGRGLARGKVRGTCVDMGKTCVLMHAHHHMSYQDSQMMTCVCGGGGVGRGKGE